jgi:hypothetical protein
MKYLFVLLFTLPLLSDALFGIGDGEKEEEPGNKNGDLSLRVKNVNFIEDNEFFNPIVEGYTLLGFFIQPELIYKPASKITLSAGVHVMKYHGLEKFSQIRPVFSTILKFDNKTSLTLGTLSGPDKHQLFDQHFFDERFYNQYVEDGIQLLHSDNHIFTDTWVSWENFIFKGDSAREQFTSGESFRYTSSPVADFITFSLPVQLQVKHFGGQISDYAEKTESFFTASGGLNVNFAINKSKSGQAGIEFLQFVNWMRSGDYISGINRGYASLIKGYYSYKAARIETGFWSAHNFYAPNGNPIYSCVSTVKPGVAIHNRKIITTSASVRFFPAAPVEFFFGVDLYYDINRNRIDQTYVLHINFDKLISLNSNKRH